MSQEHNPDNLSPEQYGAPKWRLLRIGEVIISGDQHRHGRWDFVTSAIGAHVTERHLAIRRRVSVPAPGEPTTESSIGSKSVDEPKGGEKLIVQESETSKVPCCACSGPVIEFTVPTPIWNAIVRRDGPETDKEYLCLACYAAIASSYVMTLRDRLAEVERERDALREKASLLAAVRGALSAYHAALDNRQHGGLAARAFVDACALILNQPWIQGASRTGKL